MKRYVIAALCVGLLILGSVIYRYQYTPAFYHFPIPESLTKNSTDAAQLYLFFFFSKTDCASCLEEIITVLNTLPVQFCVAGIVPEEELKDEVQLRRLTGATFSLYGDQKFKKYIPPHTPTLLGVSEIGQVILILPGMQKQGTYLESILLSVQGKLTYPIKASYPAVQHKK